MASPGCLVLVVGPSGAGKDTLLRRAAAALRDEGRYCFVRRYITRPAGDPHEDHVALTEEEFAACFRWYSYVASLCWQYVIKANRRSLLRLTPSCCAT